MSLCFYLGTPGLLQTLSVLVAEKVNMKRPPKGTIVKSVSVSMPMDVGTFRELFYRLPSAANLWKTVGDVKFSVPIAALDSA